MQGALAWPHGQEPPDQESPVPCCMCYREGVTQRQSATGKFLWNPTSQQQGAWTKAYFKGKGSNAAVLP